MPPESIWTTLVKLAIPTLLGAGLGAGLTLYGVGKTNKHNASENAANRKHALQMWDQQTRWTAKREHYEALVLGLTALLALATKIRVEEAPENKALLIDQFLTELLRAAPKLEVSKLFIKREILALHDTTCETLRSIAVFASDPVPDRMDAALKAFQNRLNEFIDAARQDLGYPAPEPPTPAS